MKLIALGWKQRHGIDCAIAFAFVCRLNNQRMLFSSQRCCEVLVFGKQQYRIWLKKGQGTHREQKDSACMTLTKDVHDELGNSSRQT